MNQLTGKRLTRHRPFCTQKPIETIAHFLTGSDSNDPAIVQIGHRRKDIAVEFRPASSAP